MSQKFNLFTLFILSPFTRGLMVRLFVLRKKNLFVWNMVKIGSETNHLTRNVKLLI